MSTQGQKGDHVATIGVASLENGNMDAWGRCKIRFGLIKGGQREYGESPALGFLPPQSKWGLKEENRSLEKIEGILARSHSFMQDLPFV